MLNKQVILPPEKEVKQLSRNQKLQNAIEASVVHQSYRDYERDNKLDKTAPDVAKLKDRLSINSIKKQFDVDPVRFTRRRARSTVKNANAVGKCLVDRSVTRKGQR